MKLYNHWALKGGIIAAISDKGDGDCSRRAPNEEGRTRFLSAAGIPASSLVGVGQVHGNTVVEAAAQDKGNLSLSEADGLITITPGVALGISVADCVPVWLLDNRTPAVGLLHAGREGTLKGISEAGLKAMQAAFGTSPEDVTAIIGPSAGPCCYEVSPEMALKYTAMGLPMRNRHLDLWEENRRQLLKTGIPSDQIHVVGECTLCTPYYHSHRRDADSSRNLAVAMILFR